MLLQIDIQKRLGAEYWTNVYYVDLPDLDAGVDAAVTIAEVEKSFHSQQVIFDKYRVSVYGPQNDNYITGPIGGSGEVTADQPLMPLFCTLNVVFTAGMNRPGRKFYRVAWTRAAVADNFTWRSVERGIALQALATLLGDVPLQDRGGGLYGTLSIDERIGMHQLRRGSKRRTQPVI